MSVAEVVCWENCSHPAMRWSASWSASFVPRRPKVSCHAMSAWIPGSLKQVDHDGGDRVPG